MIDSDQHSAFSGQQEQEQIKELELTMDDGAGRWSWTIDHGRWTMMEKIGR